MPADEFFFILMNCKRSCRLLRRKGSAQQMVVIQIYCAVHESQPGLPLWCSVVSSKVKMPQALVPVDWVFFRLNESAALLPVTREKIGTKQMVAISKNYCAVHEGELSLLFSLFAYCMTNMHLQVSTWSNICNLSHLELSLQLPTQLKYELWSI